MLFPLTIEEDEGCYPIDVENFVETEIELTLDSGCCEHVIDLADAPGYDNALEQSPGSKRRQHFVVGNGQRVPNDGQVHLNMETFDKAPMGIEACFQVAEVTRPLMSVSKICDQGLTCEFDNTSARILNDKKEIVCSFVREGGLYVARMKLKCPLPSPASPTPFGGPGR